MLDSQKTSHTSLRRGSYWLFLWIFVRKLTVSSYCIWIFQGVLHLYLLYADCGRSLELLTFSEYYTSKNILAATRKIVWLIKSWHPYVMMILRVQYVRFRLVACCVNEISPTGPRVANICNNSQMLYDRSCARNMSALIPINIYISHVARAGLTVWYCNE